MQSMKIFIVEDDTWYSEVLAYHLSLNPDYEVVRYSSGKDCIDNLYKKPSVITLDYSLPDMTGKEVLKRIKAFNPDLPVIIISAQEDIGTAVSLLKEGAFDYIVKDADTKDRLWHSLTLLRENLSLRNQISTLQDEIVQKYEFGKIIKGNSSEIKGLFKRLEKATQTNITVSITGETGTGKELVAKAIHYNSARSKKALVNVNVAAIPKDLIESELFGYEKGAFTGANTRKIGKFEEATGGTIFLDEIGEMDLNMQAKLLRVLQEKEVTRIGGTGVVKVDVRVICATHRNLSEEVRKGNFREDLYYRLLGLPIELPALRQRKSDIPLLAKFFLDQFISENKMPKVSVSTEALNRMLSYPWPGNVRELKAVIELAAVLCDDGVIEPHNISFNSANSISDIMLEELTLEEYTYRIVDHYLQKYNNNVIRAAEKLDIGKSTIYRMLKERGL